MESRKHRASGSPLLLPSQNLLNILQFAVYIRVLPSKSSVKAFSYPCYPLGDLLASDVLAHDAPYADHDRKNREQTNADINGN